MLLKLFSFGGTEIEEGETPFYAPNQESLIIFMNSKIFKFEDINKEKERVMEDNKEVCQFYTTCQWKIKVVANDASLERPIERAFSELPSNIKWKIEVSSKLFNKFTVVSDFIDQLVSYDFVLIKDSDQRIAELPWTTFIEKRSNAIISGPLRRSAVVDKKRLQFQLHEAFYYESPSSPKWAHDIYKSITPLEVPLLEMFFVLMDGQFASFFFHLLDDQRFNSESSWGPDLIWCQAAKIWNPSRPSCCLVPVVSIHEDSRQMTKNDRFRDIGKKNLHYFSKNFSLLVEPSLKWINVMKGRSLVEIEHVCRDLLSLNEVDHFDFRACAIKNVFSFLHYRKDMVQNQSMTGSWASCHSIVDYNSMRMHSFNTISTLAHPDSAYVIISCTPMHYRIKHLSLLRVIESNPSIVVGVLSSSLSDGPLRRNAVRSTWANGQNNVFFIVGGPWVAIKEEYEEYQDILWIDCDELYTSETSTLTFKTESFLAVFYERVLLKNQSISHLVKTDDDSYLALNYLNRLFHDNVSFDYWGACNTKGWKPHRNMIGRVRKWNLSYDAYPEKNYPTFCQGAGFALSRRFLSCAVGGGHAAKIRFMPNEDVAVGMLAERCGVTATHDERVQVHLDKDINMTGKLVQHDLKLPSEMEAAHKSLEQ